MKIMNIEIGKLYLVSNKYKKSYVEIETFKDFSGKTEDIVRYEIGWRSGSWEVRPTDEEEVDMLKEAMSEEFDDELDMTSFEDANPCDAWDGCWTEVDVSQVVSMKEEEVDAFQDLIQEEGNSWFFENEWEPIDMFCCFLGTINVEEVVEQG
jgi:hypothetical protein